MGRPLQREVLHENAPSFASPSSSSLAGCRRSAPGSLAHSERAAHDAARAYADPVGRTPPRETCRRPRPSRLRPLPHPRWCDLLHGGLVSALCAPERDVRCRAPLPPDRRLYERMQPGGFVPHLDLPRRLTHLGRRLLRRACTTDGLSDRRRAGRCARRPAALVARRGSPERYIGGTRTNAPRLKVAGTDGPGASVFDASVPSRAARAARCARLRLARGVPSHARVVDDAHRLTRPSVPTPPACPHRWRASDTPRRSRSAMPGRRSCARTG
jgi:hypothetical protein